MTRSLFLSAAFSLISRAYWACARTASLAIQAWWELLMAILGFSLDLCHKSMVWGLAIIALRRRVFTALYREIEDLKPLGKASCDDKTAGIIPWSGERGEGGATLQDDVVIRGQQRGGGRWEERWLFPGPDEEHRANAIRRNLFSVALSILVGLTIWEEEPRIPYVAALLTVAGMSLGRVLNFFLPIKNKLASDALVLLIINCFMIGAFSRPALPTIARAWAQYVR